MTKEERSLRLSIDSDGGFYYEPESRQLTVDNYNDVVGKMNN